MQLYLEIFSIHHLSVAGKSETGEMLKRKENWIPYVCMTFNLKCCVTTLSQD